MDPKIQEVLSRCTPEPSPSVNLLDPLKFEVTRCDGTRAKCVAVIDELEDGRFILNNVFYDQRAKGTPQFNIVLPDRWVNINKSTVLQSKRAKLSVLAVVLVTHNKCFYKVHKHKGRDSALVILHQDRKKRYIKVYYV